MATAVSYCVLLTFVALVAPSDVKGSAINFTSSETSLSPLITYSSLTLQCRLSDTTLFENERNDEEISQHVDETTSDLPHSTPDSTLHSHLQTPDSAADCDTKNDRRESLTTTTVNVDFITSIVISRDGQDVASLSEHFPAKSLINYTDVHVTGSLSLQKGQRGNLEITFDNPTINEAGNYRCDVYSIDSQGRNYLFSDSVKILEEELTLSELVKHLKNLEENAEKSTKTIAQLTQKIKTISKINGDLTSDVNTLKKTNAILNTKITALTSDAITLDKTHAMMNATIKVQAEEIAVLESKVDSSLTRVFFSAGLTHAIHTPQVIVFDKVWSNVGGGYSNSTGVFTCPVAGYYSFTVNLVSGWNKKGYLMLQHNNQGVYQAITYSNAGHQCATNSATIKLKTNDTVRVVFTRADIDVVIYSNNIEISTTFSGNLVAVA